jgi:hypothetical protein
MANPFLDHSHPLEYIEGKKVTVDDVAVPVVNSRAVVRPAPQQFFNPTEDVLVDGRLWEPGTWKTKKGAVKQLTFDKSLERLMEDGYDRHPRPIEQKRLLMRALEDDMRPQDKAMTDEMMAKEGEWLSAAAWIERESGPANPKTILTIYWDPTNIQWDTSYSWRGVPKSHSTTEYEIDSTISLNTWTQLFRLPERLVVDLYGEPYNKLHGKIQDAQVMLPPSRWLVPLSSISELGNEFDICMGPGNAADLAFRKRASTAASRGVRNNFPRRR